MNAKNPGPFEQIVQIVNDHQPHADGRVDLFLIVFERERPAQEQ